MALRVLRRWLQTWLQTTPPKLLPIARRIDRLNHGIGQLLCWLVVVMVVCCCPPVEVGQEMGNALSLRLTRELESVHLTTAHIQRDENTSAASPQGDVAIG